MKKFVAIIAALSMACTVPVDQVSENDQSTSTQQRSHDSLPRVSSGSSHCITGTPEVIVVDGITYVKTVPMQCNDGWVDPSDPSPIKEKKYVIDPPPERSRFETESQ